MRAFLLPFLAVLLPKLALAEEAAGGPAQYSLFRQQLSSCIIRTIGHRPNGRKTAELVSLLYDERLGDKRFWSTAPPEATGVLLELRDALANHGLPKLAALDPTEVNSAISNDELSLGPELGIMISLVDTALLVRFGPVEASNIWPHWDTGDRPGSEEFSIDALKAELKESLLMSPFSAQRAVAALAPQHPIYKTLRERYAMAKQRMLNYRGLPSLPNPSVTGPLEIGALTSQASALAARLQDRGYLDQLPAEIDRMSPELSQALLRFQQDQGLEADGVYGPATHQRLAHTAVSEFQALALSMHKARLLPRMKGQKYLLANIPSAELYGFEEMGPPSLTMPIVHGKAMEGQQTPVFRDVMTELVFYPYWNVPPGIAREELIPLFEEDSGYFAKNRYEIVLPTNPFSGETFTPSKNVLRRVSSGELLLRQKGGDENSLGRVKFLFPNKHSVYMHDTPWKEFFSFANRAHSHGCVRLGAPLELAKWVLRDEGWEQGKVEAPFNNDRRRYVALQKSIPVFITYLTAIPRTSPTGQTVITFPPDVYKRNEAEAKTLQKILPWRVAP